MAKSTRPNPASRSSMKTIFNHLTTLAMIFGMVVGTPFAFAQQDPADVGFVRIVPLLTAGIGKIHILIDGQDIYPSGYDVGQKTGGISLQAGSHSFVLQKTGIRSTTASFNVGRGESCTLIGFGEQEIAKVPSDPPQWKTRIIPIKKNDFGKGYGLTLVSLCPQDEIKLETEIPNRSKLPVTYLKHLVAADIDLGHSKTDVSIKVNGERVAVISLEDLGNYTMVIYEDRTGKVLGLWFYDPAFSPGG